MPFFANVDAMPDYVSNTTPEVTLDSYYWASRFLAVLGDSDYSGTAEPIAHYKQTVAALGHQMVFATDEQLARLGGKDTRDAAAREREDEEESLPADVEPMKPADVVKATRDEKTREVLAAANENMAKQLKAQTQTILAQCLQATSVNMKDAFSMADF